ncbi:hypothetical protein GH714_035639 [Hevea brasiliensis]|uniref:Uncharacterized protein n=1 Tax=Hevea brasiliensis TaxID=3981 RepID=A0A6A6KTC8_HEVBR|nr:hypothetical protein GH714_035639 [Hevea brasiliensis]
MCWGNNQKPNLPSMIQQRRDDRDFNYTKTSLPVAESPESGNKNLQPLKRIQPKMEWAKPQQTAVLAEKRWPNAGSSPSVSYSLASSLQVSTPPSKTEARFVALGSEYKNLHPGTVGEPIIMMQRPQSVNTKQVPGTSISSSPPGTAASCSAGDSPGISRGNGLCNRTGSSSALAAASSLGLFSGLGGSAGSSGASSPVDWSTAGLVAQLDYASVDWSLDRGLSSTRPSGMWMGQVI